jgi:hypothetical protein
MQPNQSELELGEALGTNQKAISGMLRAGLVPALN